MVTGIERLRAAAALLRQRANDRADRASAYAAATEVVSVVSAALDEWPSELQVRSIPLQFHLVRYGGLEETIRRLVSRELTELRQELLEFIATAEQLHGSFARMERENGPQTLTMGGVDEVSTGAPMIS